METIKKGSRGTDVTMLQRALHLIEDGYFGAITEEAVKEFQKTNGLAADGIVGPKTWFALGIPTVKSKQRKITEIIVHCTATPEGEDYQVDQIRDWHLQRGFTDIGYHWIIYRDGTIVRGRDESLTGAHCNGHNSKSIGVCYVGGCPARQQSNWDKRSKDTRTMAQKMALAKLLSELKKRYPGAKIYGHRDFANKPCPSFDARQEYINLK